MARTKSGPPPLFVLFGPTEEKRVNGNVRCCRCGVMKNIPEYLVLNDRGKSDRLTGH